MAVAEQEFRTAASARSFSADRAVPGRRAGIVVAVGMILLVAALLRFAALDSTPPGLFHDEAFYAFDAREVLTTDYRPIYFERNTGGREPLYIYLVAGAMGVLGATELTLRLVSATLGTLTVFIVFLLGRRSFGTPVGLIAAGLLATLPWHVHLSRDGFRAITLPFAAALAGWLLARAWDQRSHLDFALAGAAMGLVFYTYLAGRIFWLVPVLWALILLLGRRYRLRQLAAGFWGESGPATEIAARTSQKLWSGLALAGIVAALTMAPLTAYFVAHPDIFFARIDQVGSAESFLASRSVFLSSLPKVAGMFSLAGDPNPRHNVGALPVFDPLVSVFFYSGVLLCLVRLRRPAASLVLVWAAVMLLPTALSEEAPHYLRAGGALPALVLFPAIAVAWLLRRLPAGGRRAAGPVIAAGLLALAGTTGARYFGDFVQSAEAYTAYGADIEAACRAAATIPSSEAVLYSHSLYRHATCRFVAPNEPEFRWFDGRESLVFPAPDGRPVNLIAPRETLAPDFELVLSKAEQIAGPLAGPLGTSFVRYRLPAENYRSLWESLAPQHPLEMQAGDRLRLRGYSIDRGSDAQVIYVYWDVLSPSSSDLSNTTAFSVRLVGRQGQTWDQRDGLGYLDPQWQPGDRVITRFPLRLPDDAPPGEFHPEVVIYQRQTKQPVSVAGAGGPTDRVVLPGFAWPAGRVADPAQLPLPDQSVERTIRPGLFLRGVDLPATVRSGESVELTWHWVLAAAGDPNAGGPVAVGLQRAGNSAAPTEWLPVQPVPEVNGVEWVSGQAVRVRTSFPVSHDLPPGSYDVLLAPTPGSALGTPVNLGTLRIEGRSPIHAVPEFESAIGVTFAEVGELVGLSVDPDRLAPGGTVRVTLVWRATGSTEKPLNVFVHLAEASGRPVAQHDGPPAGGEAPSTTWTAGEIIVDEHAVTVPLSLSPGNYQLLIGLYDPETGQRRSTGSGTDFVVGGTLVADP